jgi:hypothetical protein
MLRVYFVVGMAYVTLCAATIAIHASARPAPPPVRTQVVRVAPPTPPAASGAAWFQSVKPYCNALEVETQQRSHPAPHDAEGAAYSAACYALGGKIAHAHAVIDSLSAPSRAWAAGIVFNVGHPVADAGDNESAGPIMRLVLDYQPDNYMALYHAGMAEYTLGDHERARTHLTAFRRLYATNDFFGVSADSALRAMHGE